MGSTGKSGGFERLGDVAWRVLAGLAVAREEKRREHEAPASDPTQGGNADPGEGTIRVRGKVGGAPRQALVPVAVVRTAGGGQPPLPRGEKGKAGAVESASRRRCKVQP
jgi:hypothetical protein